MFWKFNLIQTSHIETLLTKENVTLQELMDEQYILQECKAQHKALTEFLIRPEVMTEMVNLVITEPQEDLDEKVKYKYSNLASELLTADVPQINDALANDKALLNKLYGFLETDKPLNPLLASFFSKTMGILISRKTETILEFLKSKDFINMILNHLRTSAIMDLLLSLVTCPDNAGLRLDILNWLNQQQTVQRLLALIDSTSEEDRHCNASQAICDIIRMARDQHNQLQEKLDFDPLLQTIESSEVIVDLLTHMFNGENSESALVSGILVLLTLLELKKPGPNLQQQQQQQQQSEQSSMYFRPEAQETMSPQEEERLKQGVMRAALAIKPKMKDFHQLLIEPPKKNPICTTVGTLDPPLGSTRIHVVRLVSSLATANVHSVNAELANLGTLDLILDLFFQYSWNNFVHTQVELCIGTILSNASTEDDHGQKEDPPLLDYLFTKCNLITRILNAWDDNDKEESKPGGHRRGYMGHLTLIANHVVENAESGSNSALIADKLKALSDDVRGKWEAFVNGPLADINKKNLVLPVGPPNSQLSSEDDSEVNSYPHEGSHQQAFSDYQMQQMTSTFVDQFAYNDNQFSEHEENVNGSLERLTNVSFSMSAEEDARRELFERACNERIRPLDDADSDDEDIWDDKEITFTNVIDRRQGSGSLVPPRTTRVESDHSTDSEGEESETKPIPVSSSTPTPHADETKMDVDQGECLFRCNNVSWPANFDAIPMDTGNPWESPSHGEAAPVQQLSQETGWADFGSFGNFGSTNFSRSGISSSTPVAMETSEEQPSIFKVSSSSDCEKRVFSSVKTSGDATDDISVTGVDSRPSLPDSSSPSLTSTFLLHAGNGTSDSTSLDASAAPSTASSSSTVETSSNADKGSNVDGGRDNSPVHDDADPKAMSSDNDTKDGTDTDGGGGERSTCEGDGLSQNFYFLLSAGMIRKDGESSSLVNESSLQQQTNGPTSESADENRQDVQTKVEEVRAKALEEFEQLTSTVGLTPNGPV